MHITAAFKRYTNGMTDLLDSRVHVVAGPTTLAVTLVLGETQIHVKAPKPRG